MAGKIQGMSSFGGRMLEAALRSLGSRVTRPFSCEFEPQSLVRLSVLAVSRNCFW